MKKASKLAAVFAAAAMCLGMFAMAGCAGGGSGASSASSAASSGANEVEIVEDETELTGIHNAQVTVEGFDPFTIQIDADAAPISAANFIKLANEGYYDGLTFYRIQDEFCMQGGTKGNNAAGNDASLEPIKGEFSGNGVDNPLADDFKAGTVAMARTSQPDSATSTFFITLSSSYVGSLNGEYAAFGTIDEAGMQIVNAIVEKYGAYADQADMGMIADEAKQPVITSIKIVD